MKLKLWSGRQWTHPASVIRQARRYKMSHLFPLTLTENRSPASKQSRWVSRPPKSPEPPPLHLKWSSSVSIRGSSLIRTQGGPPDCCKCLRLSGSPQLETVWKWSRKKAAWKRASYLFDPADLELHRGVFLPLLDEDGVQEWPIIFF